jgi:hypothetical protein
MEAIVGFAKTFFHRYLIMSLSILFAFVVVYDIKRAISSNVSDINNTFTAKKATRIFGYIVILAFMCFPINLAMSVLP